MHWASEVDAESFGGMKDVSEFSAGPSRGALTVDRIMLCPRYGGDFLHLAGIVTLLATIVKRQSVTGLSQKTQLLSRRGLRASFNSANGIECIA